MPNLNRGRELAMARMLSRVTIWRENGDEVVNGIERVKWELIYAGVPFRLVDGQSTPVTVGGIDFADATGRGDLPAVITNLQDNDLIEVTRGEWVGSVFRVVKAIKGDQMTARRVPVVEVNRPTEWVL